MRMLPSALIVLTVVGLIAPVHASAQGNGNGRPKGPKTGQTPAPAPAPAPAGSPAPTPVAAPAPVGTATPVTTATSVSAGLPLAPTPDFQAPAVTFRQFGSWLDDASAPTRGEGYSSIGVGYWRLSGLSQTNMPMLGAGLGVTDRLLVSGSVPFYRVDYGGGTARGMDDVYLGAKYNVIDPTLSLSEVGLSAGAVVEILSAGAPGGRVHFALPVSVELRRLPFRVYGSAGYFTRGSLFSAGAVEWTAPSRVTFTAALAQSYSLTEDTLLDSMAVGRQRIDITGGVAYPLGRVAAAYASIGRSLKSSNNDGTQMGVSGGVSFRFRAIQSTR